MFKWLLVFLLWPAIALAQFNGLNGVFALNQMTFGLMSSPSSPLTIVNAGSGYTTNDTIILDCGSIYVTGTRPMVSVLASGGHITGVSLVNPGVATQIPSTGLAGQPNGDCKFTQNATSGGGTGAVIHGFYGFIAASSNLADYATVAGVANSINFTVGVPQGGTGQTTFTAGLPLIGNGTGALAQGTVSGTTTKFPVVDGTTTSGQCAVWDSAGGLSSVNCSPAGSGTVGSGTVGELPVYTGSTAIAGTTTGAGVISAISKPVNTSGGLLAFNAFNSNIPNASGSSLTTTGDINSGSTSLSLAATLDWANNEGIIVNHAGPNFTLAVPSGFSLVESGTPGTTTYNYAIASLDGNGGVSSTSGGPGTVTGNATLSSTNYNTLSWGAVSGAVGYAVYWYNGSNYVCIGVTTGTNFVDSGGGTITTPFWLPATLAGTLNDWLKTTIVSGEGTTSLTLANAATNTITGASIVHDDTVAIQTAVGTLASLHPQGGTINLGNGKYNITSSIVLGNGTSTTPSTSTGMILQGFNQPMTGLQYGMPDPTSGLNMLNVGGSGIIVVGPLEGWALTNVAINCNNLGGDGLYTVSVHMGQITNLSTLYCYTGIVLTTSAVDGTYLYDNYGNQYNNIFIKVPWHNVAYGIDIESNIAGCASDADYNTFTNVTIANLTGTGRQIGIHLQCADTNVFNNVHTVNTTISSVVFDYTNTNRFPTSNLFFGIDPGTQGITNNGSADTNAPNIIYGLAGANGATCPSLTMLSCHAN